MWRRSPTRGIAWRSHRSTLQYVYNAFMLRLDSGVATDSLLDSVQVHETYFLELTSTSYAMHPKHEGTVSIS